MVLSRSSCLVFITVDAIYILQPKVMCKEFDMRNICSNISGLKSNVDCTLHFARKRYSSSASRIPECDEPPMACIFLHLSGPSLLPRLLSTLRGWARNVQWKSISKYGVSREDVRIHGFPQTTSIAATVPGSPARFLLYWERDRQTDVRGVAMRMLARLMTPIFQYPSCLMT